MTANEQLFTELTPEEGAAVSGGFQRYYVGNKSGIGVNYEIQYINRFGNPVRKKEFVGSNKQDVFLSLNRPLVTFDSKIGSGVNLKAESLTPGKNNFDRAENFLILTTGENGPVANLT